MRFNDDRAQWLLLSGLVISMGLITLILLLNNSVLSGHSSTQSITSFPKNELRDLRSNSINEVLILGQTINAGNNTNVNQVLDYFNYNFTNFSDKEMYNIYLLHGGLIDIDAIPETDMIGSNWIITNVSLSINYTDSNTVYFEKMHLGIQG